MQSSMGGSDLWTLLCLQAGETQETHPWPRADMNKGELWLKEQTHHAFSKDKVKQLFKGFVDS